MKQELTFHQLDMLIGDHAPFLLSLSDQMDAELRLVICAAELGAPDSGLPDLSDYDAKTAAALRRILSGTRPIEPSDTTQYEIIFPQYILYQTRNESFYAFDKHEIRSGRFLTVYERSHLLDQVPHSTLAQQWDDGRWYPGKWTHYGIFTQNHVIDVISHEMPIIQRIDL